MIARLRRNYIGTLTGSLALYSSPGSRDSGHRQEQKPLSASSLIEDSLAESDETTVLQALEMLPLVKDRDWQPALDSLLHHSSARVRTTAIGLVRQQPGPGLASSLADLVTDPDDEVRAQAVLAYCESAGSSCLRLAQALLEDPVPRVQAMAAAGILRHGGIAGANQALPVLLQLHHGEQAPARQAAALAIGLAGMEVFARDLLPLLSDEDDGVRQEAILAAGRLRGTLDLARVGAEGRAGRLHPATRVFQALRMLVNQELEELRALLQALPEPLRPGGRAVIISFHSAEDRLVKNRFADLAGRCRCPPHLPECRCGARARVRLLNRRARRPSPAEVAANPRARSARLRALERLAA